MFLQFTPAYGFAFLQSGILPRTVFHKPPGRKTRCGKRTQTVVFHTVFAMQARRRSCPPSGDDAEVTPSGANAPAPPRGELFAVTETYRMNDKSFRQRSCLSLWERWICEAKTERAHAASLVTKVSRAIKNFAATTKSRPLEEVPHKKCRAVRRPSGIAFFFTSYCGTPAVRSGNTGSGCKRPRWW